MKKLKPLLLTVLCLVLLALCAGCASSATATKTKLIVGLDDSFPPMGYRDDDNNIVGFDVDLAAEVAKRLNLELELKPIDWDAKVLELNSGSVDCLWNGLTITPEREEEMDFSRPYLANQQVIIVLADSDITGIPSLAGKIVGLQKGSSALDALNKNDIVNEIASVQEYADNVTALTDLSIGRVDAVLLDEVVARYYETKEEGTYKVLDDSFAAEEYGIGFKKGSELKDQVQKVFDEMIADGTAAEISEKWFGKDIIVNP